MATVTRIKTDATNYSVYDPQRARITATAYLAGTNPGDQVTLTLVRLDGYGSVLSVTSPPLTSGQANVKLVFDPTLAVDPQYPKLNRAKSGDYQVQWGTPATVSSPTFSLSLVSVRRFRQEICLGLPLLTGETVGPLVQPQACTGVVIQSVDPTMLQASYTLSYTTATQTLSWDSGTAVAVGATGGGSYYLQNGRSLNWIQVQVDETQLPTTNAQDVIPIGEQPMSDAMILAEIRHAQAQVADYLMTYLEPTQVATQHMAEFIHAPTQPLTPPTNDFQDVIASPLNYTKSYDLNQWYAIQIPVRYLLQVEAVHGFFNTTDVVTLDAAWWSWDERSGLLSLVPNQMAVITWSAYSGFFFSFLMGSYNNVPQFWHYKVTAGLRDLRERRANVLQLVEYTAAVNVLRQAALHAKPGYVSESLQRDGLTSSTQYQQGAGGVYASTILQYEKWISENQGKIRTRIYGINVRFL